MKLRQLSDERNASVFLCSETLLCAHSGLSSTKSILELKDLRDGFIYTFVHTLFPYHLSKQVTRSTITFVTMAGPLRSLYLFSVLSVFANLALSSVHHDAFGFPALDLLKVRQDDADCTADDQCTPTDYGCQCGFIDGSFMDYGSMSSGISGSSSFSTSVYASSSLPASSSAFPSSSAISSLPVSSSAAPSSYPPSSVPSSSVAPSSQPPPPSSAPLPPSSSYYSSSFYPYSSSFFYSGSSLPYSFSVSGSYFLSSSYPPLPSSSFALFPFGIGP